jgi:hypothetical protein
VGVRALPLARPSAVTGMADSTATDVAATPAAEQGRERSGKLASGEIPCDKVIKVLAPGIIREGASTGSPKIGKMVVGKEMRVKAESRLADGIHRFQLDTGGWVSAVSLKGQALVEVQSDNTHSGETKMSRTATSMALRAIDGPVEEPEIELPEPEEEQEPRDCNEWLFVPLLDNDGQRVWDLAQENYGKIILHPDCNFNSIWDVLSMILILYSCLTIPYRLAFHVEAAGAYAVFDRVVDAVFLLDCAMTFRKATYHEGVLVAAPSRIANVYLKGWFIPDLMSSFPFDLLIDASGSDTDPEAARLLKIIRILRMVKILRMVRIQRLLKKMQESFGIKNGVMISIKFMLFTMFAAHFQACLWFGMSNCEEDGCANWATSYCIKATIHSYDDSCGNVCGYIDCANECAQSSGDALAQCMDACIQCDVQEQYVASFYWSVVTLTTLGYGDVTPSTHSERLFCIYAMLLGASIFAYSVTNMCTLVHNLNPADVFFRTRLDEINDYMVFLGIERPLAKRCAEFFQYKANYSNVCVYNEDLILQDMSVSMQEDVRLQSLRTILEAVPIFKNKSESLLKALAVKMESVPLSHGQVITAEGAILTALHIVGKGHVTLSTAEDGEVHQINELGMFGLAALFRPTKFSYTASSKEYVDLYSLSRYRFEDALEVQKYQKMDLEMDAIRSGLITEDAPTTAGQVGVPVVPACMMHCGVLILITCLPRPKCQLPDAHCACACGAGRWDQGAEARRGGAEGGAARQEEAAQHHRGAGRVHHHTAALDIQPAGGDPVSRRGVMISVPWPSKPLAVSGSWRAQRLDDHTQSVGEE